METLNNQNIFPFVDHLSIKLNNNGAMQTLSSCSLLGSGFRLLVALSEKDMDACNAHFLGWITAESCFKAIFKKIFSESVEIHYLVSNNSYGAYEFAMDNGARPNAMIPDSDQEIIKGLHIAAVDKSERNSFKFIAENACILTYGVGGTPVVIDKSIESTDEITYLTTPQGFLDRLELIFKETKSLVAAFRNETAKKQIKSNDLSTDHKDESLPKIEKKVSWNDLSTDHKDESLPKIEKKVSWNDLSTDHKDESLPKIEKKVSWNDLSTDHKDEGLGKVEGKGNNKDSWEEWLDTDFVEKGTEKEIYN